jgi:hypothetical protein
MRKQQEFCVALYKAVEEIRYPSNLSLTSHHVRLHEGGRSIILQVDLFSGIFILLKFF